jgi:hypothetical protein
LFKLFLWWFIKLFLWWFVTPPQVRRGAHDVELGSQEGEVRWGSGFGEDVSRVVFTGDETNMQGFGGDSITNEVEVNLDVFGPSMEGGVGKEAGGPNVVTP